MSDPVQVAYDALNLAREAKRDVEAHEDVCAERYSNINQTLGQLKAILAWGGGLTFTTLLGALGWMVVQQIDSSASETALLRAKIEFLQQQRK